MNINESIRDKRKLVEKLRWYIFKITYISTCYRRLQNLVPKGEFQICPRMDFDNILYVEYLRYNNYKNEIISFLKGCQATGGHLDVHPLCTNI